MATTPRAATRAVVGFATLGVLAVAACAPAVTTKPPATAPVAATAPSAPASPVLPPLTAEQAELATRLRATVTHLATDIGERNLGDSWKLATATDDLARTLEKMGYEVRRQGIPIGDDVVQNLEATSGGGKHGDESIVVGAHYDTAKGTPGADDDATGVAALIELARAFYGKKTSRVVRFALFANEEEPYFATPQMGSVVYAKDLVAHGVTVAGMLSLESLGVFATTPGSQGAPKNNAAKYPNIGDFIAIESNDASRPFSDRVAASLRKNGALPVVSVLADADRAPANSGDQWVFDELHVPAVMITDTRALRDAANHQAGDVPERLDYDRLARVVSALEVTLDELLSGEQ